MKFIKYTLFLLLSQSVCSQNYSYIWGMHFPNLVDPAEQCCFDYDNDSSLDDGLGDILLTLQDQSNSDFQMGIDDAILNNILVKAFDWKNLDLDLPNQDFTFQYLDAQNFTPGLNLVDRMSGLTELYIPPGQPENLFNANVNAGLVNATATEITGLLNLQFDMDQGLVPLTLHDVKLQAQIVDSPNGLQQGIYSVDMAATNPSVVGGIKIGGILPSDEFLSVIDNQYRMCTCASIDPNSPLISTSIFFGTIIVSCQQSNLTPENCPVNSFCSTVGTFCSNAIGLGTTFDIDENGDSVNDAYSVALRLGAAAATVDVIFFHGFETP